MAASLKAVLDEVHRNPAAAVKQIERPVGELDATLTYGNHKIEGTLEVYGRLQPHFPGDREQPDEPEFIEIDRVILSSGPDSKVDIYDALSWSDLQNISDAIMEEL